MYEKHPIRHSEPRTAVNGVESWNIAYTSSSGTCKELSDAFALGQDCPEFLAFFGAACTSVLFLDGLSYSSSLASSAKLLISRFYKRLQFAQFYFACQIFVHIKYCQLFSEFLIYSVTK